MSHRETITIPGKPIPYPRTRGGHRHAPGYIAFRDAARWHIRSSRGSADHLTGPLIAEIVVASDHLTVSLAEATGRRPRGLRGDLDNYVKSALDLTHITGPRGKRSPLWLGDDSQIIGIEARFELSQRFEEENQ